MNFKPAANLHKIWLLHISGLKVGLILLSRDKILQVAGGLDTGVELSNEPNYGAETSEEPMDRR